MRRSVGAAMELAGVAGGGEEGGRTWSRRKEQDGGVDGSDEAGVWQAHWIGFDTHTVEERVPRARLSACYAWLVEREVQSFVQLQGKDRRGSTSKSLGFCAWCIADTAHTESTEQPSLAPTFLAHAIRP